MSPYSKIRLSLQNNYVRFGVTAMLAALYSALRSTEYSAFVKPLPIMFWCLVVIASPKRVEGRWVLASLCAAFVGDILLDLGEGWLIIATVPFLGSTLLLALAFHLRSRGASIHAVKDISLLLPILLGAILFYHLTAPHMELAARRIGAVLLGLSVLLLWRSLAVAMFSDDPRLRRLAGVIGACGIVANYLLYSVNLGIRPVPRDLVIQVYYWGQAFAAWSFLKSAHAPAIRRA
ncbi:MAG: lysoplasmalogenase family protein [Maricaulaceae bacterium]